MQKQKPLSPLWIDMVGARRNGMPSASHSSQSATKRPFSIPVQLSATRRTAVFYPWPAFFCSAKINGAKMPSTVRLAAITEDA
jgi:hypothetical protein